MAFWNRNADKPAAPPDPPAPVPPPIPELDELAELIPERGSDEAYYWQPYVDRIIQRFDGLPAPDGGGTFVRACLSTGCKGVPAMQQNVVWRNRQPGPEYRQARINFQLHVRLGLFFAASLRYLVHALCRLRIRDGKTDWHPLMDTLRAGDVYWRPLLGGGVSFRELQAAHESGLAITWLDTQPTHAQVATLAPYFFEKYERSLITLELAVDVMACVEPGAPGGMFGYMLYHTDRIDVQRPDVARIFLKALRQLAWSRRLRLNTNPGDLFVTPEVSLLVTPVALDVVTEVLRKRGYSFGRAEIYRALGDAGCLAGIAPGAGRHTVLARLKSSAWRTSFRVHGLLIVHDTLWDVQSAPGFFDGTISILD